MRVYSRKESSPFKWVLAAILFIVVMTFTLAEVNGFPVTPNQGNTNTDSDENSIDHNTNSGSTQRTPETPTTVVPEPGTLLLMATGLSAVYVFRKTRKATI